MKSTVILVALILSITIPAAAVCSDTDKKALAAFDAAWSKAGQSGDKAALMSIYADDYMGLPGMQGKTEAIEATMRNFERNKANPAGADKVTSDHYIISCTPMSATITHRNVIWTPNGSGGKPETFYARSVHVLEKRNGNWQVVSNAGNDLDEYAILWYLEQDWNDAMLKKDKAWFETNFAADYSGIGSTNARLVNKTEEIADMMNPKVTMELVETTGMNIRIDGNFAVVTGVFRTKGKDENGKAFDIRSRYTDTWIKRDGRWQAWASQGTVIPEPEKVAKN